MDILVLLRPPALGGTESGSFEALERRDWPNMLAKAS